MKLLESLLESPKPSATTAPAPQRAQRAGRITAPLAEDVQRVKRMIVECKDSFLTLNSTEIKALRSLVENCSPFVRDKFITGDLELLGLGVDENSQQTNNRSSATRTGSEEEDDGTGSLPTYLALIAPDFTPAAAEPIPFETARSVLPDQPAPPPSPRQPREHVHIPSEDEDGDAPAPTTPRMSESALYDSIQNMVMHGAPEKPRRSLSESSEPRSEREKAASLKIRGL